MAETWAPPDCGQRWESLANCGVCRRCVETNPRPELYARGVDTTQLRKAGAGITGVRLPGRMITDPVYDAESGHLDRDASNGFPVMFGDSPLEGARSIVEAAGVEINRHRVALDMVHDVVTQCLAAIRSGEIGDAEATLESLCDAINPPKGKEPRP